MKRFQIARKMLLRAAPLVILASSAFAAVDPGLLDLVPSNARILYGVNVQPALSSSVGRAVYTHVLARNPLLDRMGAVSGLDVKRDVRELLFVASGDNRVGNLPRYDLILARGTFRPDRLQTLASLMGAKTVDNHGVTVITPPADTSSNSLAVLDSSTVAIGSANILNAVIAQQIKSSGHASALAQKAITASATNDVWFATITPFSDLALGHSSLPTALLEAIRQSWGGMRFVGDSLTLTVDGVTRSEQDAKTLAGLMSGMVRMIKDPRTKALQQAQFSTSGASISVFVSMNQRDAQLMLQKKDAKRGPVMAGGASR